MQVYTPECTRVKKLGNNGSLLGSNITSGGVSPPLNSHLTSPGVQSGVAEMNASNVGLPTWLPILNCWSGLVAMTVGLSGVRRRRRQSGSSVCVCVILWFYWYCMHICKRQGDIVHCISVILFFCILLVCSVWVREVCVCVYRFTAHYVMLGRGMHKKIHLLCLWIRQYKDNQLACSLWEDQTS